MCIRDSDEEDRVNEILPYVTNAQIGNSTNADFLKSLGIGNFDICFVTISANFENSLETTSLLKELGAKIVISRAERDIQMCIRDSQPFQTSDHQLGGNERIQ